MNTRPYYFFVCLAAALPLLMPANGFAQVRLGPNGPVEVEQEGKFVETVGAAPVEQRGAPKLSRIRLRPAAEPVPALKYSFVPDYRDLKPGNAAPYYYRSLLQFDQVRNETVEKMSQMCELAVPEFDTNAADDVLTEFSHVLHNIEIATHREECNWQWRVRDLEGVAQLQFLLQEIQDLRRVGRLLSLKAANHLAKGQFEQAAETITAGYRIAHDVSQPRFLVNDLVGIAIAGMMNDRVVEMIDAEDSPNLYWAMASLPRPLISMRRSLEHEKSLPYSFFSFLRDPETTKRSDEEWKRLVTTEMEVFAQSLGEWGTKDNLLRKPEALIAAVYPRAKRELVAMGFEKERLEKMSVAQTVAIHESRELNRMLDTVFKWSLLPYHEAENLANVASEAIRPYDPFAGTGESLPIGSLLMPAAAAAAQAEIRLQTQIDGIRVVEALRMQMAADDGAMPKQLGDVTVVPVPRNPSTNEPFSYENGVLELTPGKDPSVQQIWLLELRPAN